MAGLFQNKMKQTEPDLTQTVTKWARTKKRIPQQMQQAQPEIIHRKITYKSLFLPAERHETQTYSQMIDTNSLHYFSVEFHITTDKALSSASHKQDSRRIGMFRYDKCCTNQTQVQLDQDEYLVAAGEIL